MSAKPSGNLNRINIFLTFYLSPMPVHHRFRFIVMQWFVTKALLVPGILPEGATLTVLQRLPIIPGHRWCNYRSDLSHALCWDFHLCIFRLRPEITANTFLQLFILLDSINCMKIYLHNSYTAVGIGHHHRSLSPWVHKVLRNIFNSVWQQLVF